MSSVKATIKDMTKEFANKADIALADTFARMAKDIEIIAKEVVPHDQGTLQNSIRIVAVNPLHYIISAGAIPPVPYARRWEFEDANFKEGRMSHYLEYSLEQVWNYNEEKIRQAIGSIKI